MTRLTSTTFTLSGARTDDELRAVWLEVSRVPDIGAVAFEVEPDQPAQMIIKHKESVVPDRDAISEAVREAGYDLS